MAFGLNKAKFSPIAIDFGADSLKLLQVVPGEPPQLVAAAAVTIPGEARAEKSARLSFLGSALRQLLKAQEFRGRRAICSIPAFQTMVQHVELPRAEAGDPQQQLNLHLMERFNVDPARLVIRTAHVGQRQQNGATMREVLCLAAPRDVVMSYIRIAEEAKIEVVGMHSEPPAIVKGFEQLYNRRADDQKQVRCFIDIGAATTKVVIAQGHTMVFAKTINAAGDHLTHQLAEARSLTFDEARSSRTNEGVGIAPPPGLAPSDESPTGRERRVNAIEHRETGLAVLDARPASQTEPEPEAATPKHPEETLEILTDELKMCVRHYNSMHGDRPIDRLVFLGGEARHTATCQAIARQLRIAAQLGDPFARLVRIGGAKHAPGVNLDEPQPGWAVPFGLCHSEANL
ncbi:MAG: pilus assembly protein PilM [Planctomycetes bacterium]|nr:pilus assembly protein PilM [Planctomycetota bacterium]